MEGKGVVSNLQEDVVKGSAVSKKKREGGMRLQLYNSQHKVDLLKLFTNVRRFTLGVKDGYFEKQEEGQEVEFKESDDEEESQPKLVQDESSESNRSEENEQEIKQLSCGTCGVTFTHLGDLRHHFRLDWHRYNVKRKLHGQDKVNEAQFDDMMGE